MRKVTLLVLFIIYAFSLKGQSDISALDSLSSFYDMSLEQLEKVKASGVSSELEKILNSLIGLASQKTLTSRESPSIISFITEEEIKKSGARDLIDILKLVPGFDFAYDGESTIGVGFRGNWVNEGKMLLLLDGIEMNDIFSASLSFGNRYSVASISKIEIIRGPGSAIYGGFAEFGVVNIITKKGADINGGYGQLTNGQLKDSFARRNFEFGLGKRVRDFDFSLTGIVGQGNRSEQEAFINTSLRSATLMGVYKSLSGNAKDNPSQFVLKSQFKDLSAKIVYDNYETTLLSTGTRDGNRFLRKSAPSFFSELKYTARINKKLSITPRLSYINQAPKLNGLPDTLRLSQNPGSRIRLSTLANCDLTRKINVVVGVELFHDNTTSTNDSIQTLNGFVESISYSNYSFFTQATAKNRIVNLILGARYDKNSKFGEAFVPRIGLTKRFQRLHFKLLYSGSFRAPTLQNIATGVGNLEEFTKTRYASPLKPEKTTVAEFEIGYQLTRDLIITANTFSTSTTNPIVYSSQVRLYSNFEKSGSNGYEAEIKFRKSWGFVTANYSFYTVNGNSKIPTYTTREVIDPSSQLPPTGPERNGSSLLAFATHKFSFNGSFHLGKSLTLNSNFNYYGERYGYEPGQIAQTSNYQVELKRFEPISVVNFNISYSDLFTKRLVVNAGVNNIFDSTFNYLTPFYSNAGSLPSTYREVVLRIAYNFNF